MSGPGPTMLWGVDLLRGALDIAEERGYSHLQMSVTSEGLRLEGARSEQEAVGQDGVRYHFQSWEDISIGDAEYRRCLNAATGNPPSPSEEPPQ